MQAERQESYQLNHHFTGLHIATSCSHKVVQPVSGTKLTLTFFSGLRGIVFFYVFPEFLRQGVELKRLPLDVGLYSNLGWINSLRSLRNHWSLFVFHIKMLLSQFLLILAAKETHNG